MVGFEKKELRSEKLLVFTKASNEDLGVFFPNEILPASPYDRMNSRLTYKPDFFEFQLKCESIEDLKQIPNGNYSWSDCCDMRATQLMALNRDKYFLLYSGGIDSSTALVALLRNWPKDFLARLSIVLSHQSVLENPDFFQSHVAHFPLLNSYHNYWQAALSSNAMVITGELGDQLFGSDILSDVARIYGTEALFSCYKNIAPKILGTYLKSKENGEKLFLRLEPIAAEAPFPLKTSHDFFWWLNFTQKWQQVKYRFLEFRNTDRRIRYGSHILHFYDSPEFQVWSLNNHDKKLGSGWDSYKGIAKEYLFSHTKCPAMQRLQKIQSLKSLYILTSKTIATDSEYNPIETLEDLEKYVRKNN